MKIRFVLALGAMAMTGCGGDQVSQNVYEGLKTRERVLHPEEGSSAQELPAYHEYEAERKRVVK